MGEFKFKDTVENLKTNLLDNLGRWVPTAIAANGIINGIIAYILFSAPRRSARSFCRRLSSRQYAAPAG